jgi:hypothetical protein
VAIDSLVAQRLDISAEGPSRPRPGTTGNHTKAAIRHCYNVYAKLLASSRGRVCMFLPSTRPNRPDYLCATPLPIPCICAWFLSHFRSFYRRFGHRTEADIAPGRACSLPTASDATGRVLQRMAHRKVEPGDLCVAEVLPIPRFVLSHPVSLWVVISPLPSSLSVCLSVCLSVSFSSSRLLSCLCPCCLPYPIFSFLSSWSLAFVLLEYLSLILMLSIFLSLLSFSLSLSLCLSLSQISLFLSLSLSLSLSSIFFRHIGYLLVEYFFS